MSASNDFDGVADQTVTVTGVSDDLVDGTQTTTITPTINDVSSENDFDGVADQLDTVFSTPVHSVASALVFCSSPAQVRHIIVNGEILIEDAKLSSIDEQGLLAEAETAARALFKRAGIESRLTKQ